MVVIKLVVKESSENRRSKQDFPTPKKKESEMERKKELLPESPMINNLINISYWAVRAAIFQTLVSNDVKKRNRAFSNTCA